MSGLGRPRPTGLGWVFGFVVIVIVSAVGVAAVLTVVAGALRDDGTPVLSLEVGQCAALELPPRGPGLERVDVVDCAGAHTAEVFHVGQLDPEGDLEYPPTDDILFRLVIQQCVQSPEAGRVAPFERYVGAPLDATDLDVLPIAPDRDAWVPTGGRFVCLVIPPNDDDVLVGSVRDSAS